YLVVQHVLRGRRERAVDVQLHAVARTRVILKGHVVRLLAVLAKPPRCSPHVSLPSTEVRPKQRNGAVQGGRQVRLIHKSPQRRPRPLASTGAHSRGQRLNYTRP